MSTRVLIVDDHAVVRSGLKLVLEAEDGIEPVGEAGTARDAVFEARSTKPDVILLDVVMPDQSGLEIIPTLLQEHPEVRILVLSMQDDPRYVREAFAAGARGYVLKEAADNEVVAAVREVASGGRYVHPELGARLVAAESEERRRAEEDPLSERESEVLRLLALGHTNQEIAKQLFISVRTAETHRAHIMQKLRLSRRGARPLRARARTDGEPAAHLVGPVVGRPSDRRRAVQERPPGAEGPRRCRVVHEVGHAALDLRSFEHEDDGPGAEVDVVAREPEARGIERRAGSEQLLRLLLATRAQLCDHSDSLHQPHPFSKITSTLSCSYPVKRCSAWAGTKTACPSRSSTNSPSTSSVPVPSSTM